jgi:hypothetical protein
VFRFAIGVDETAFTRATAAKPTVFAPASSTCTAAS